MSQEQKSDEVVQSTNRNQQKAPSKIDINSLNEVERWLFDNNLPTVLARVLKNQDLETLNDLKSLGKGQIDAIANLMPTTGLQSKLKKCMQELSIKTITSEMTTISTKFNSLISENTQLKKIQDYLLNQVSEQATLVKDLQKQNTKLMKDLLEATMVLTKLSKLNPNLIELLNQVPDDGEEEEKDEYGIDYVKDRTCGLCSGDSKIIKIKEGTDRCDHHLCFSCLKNCMQNDISMQKRIPVCPLCEEELNEQNKKTETNNENNEEELNGNEKKPMKLETLMALLINQELVPKILNEEDMLKEYKAVLQNTIPKERKE